MSGTVSVHLWSALRRLTDGQQVVEVEASNVGEMLDALVAAHPGLGPIIESGVSVVIDGEMSTGRQVPLSPDNEVYLLQRLKGG